MSPLANIWAINGHAPTFRNISSRLLSKEFTGKIFLQSSHHPIECWNWLATLSQFWAGLLLICSRLRFSHRAESADRRIKYIFFLQLAMASFDWNGSEITPVNPLISSQPSTYVGNLVLIVFLMAIVWRRQTLPQMPHHQNFENCLGSLDF